MNALSLSPTCPSFLNSSYFDHHSYNCLITPVIGSGHAYIKIACEILGIEETLGFYPSFVSTNPEQKQEDMLNQMLPPQHFPKWYVQARQTLEYGIAFFQYGSLAGSTSMPFPSTSGGKYLGKNLAVNGVRGSLALQATAIPSKIHGSYHKGQYKVPGQVVSDRRADRECGLFGEDTCKEVSIRSTPNQILKAMEYAEYVHKMGQRAMLTGQVDDVSLKDGVYKVINNNCVDFVINLINKVGNAHWIEHLKDPYASSHFGPRPSRLEQMQFMAWNYLQYTSWRDS